MTASHELICQCSVTWKYYLWFLAHDAFVRTNLHAIAMVFVHLSFSDGHALWSYGALYCRFKFTIG